jgi:xanthine dehydrogenase YagS FAD-binding subunit
VRTFTYLSPASPAEAVQAMAEAGPGAKYLGGGTTLADLMKLGVEAPAALIDVSRITELEYIDASRGDFLVLGAGARLSDVSAHPVIKRDYPVLAESLWRSASQQLRNMATIAGVLLQRTRCPYFRDGYPCNKRDPGSGCSAIGGIDRSHAVLGVSDSCIATYAGDFPVAALALDAQVDVAGVSGERTIPLSQLHVEPGDTPHIEHTLALDELITRVRIPLTRAGRGSAYLKIRDRESYAFAQASAAVALVLDGDGTITEARVGLGGVATRPWRAKEAEAALLGRPLTDESARQAGDAALAGARPGNLNAFKIELAKRTLGDALRTAAERAVSR